jgi:hypothetical protein
MKARTNLPVILFLFFVLFSIAIEAFASSPVVLGGAYDELLPNLVKGRPFVFSGKARWEYDDNIYAEENNEVASWVLSIEPKVDYRKLTEASLLQLSYQFSYRWFENRPEDNEDLSHDVGVILNHMFSESFELRLRDNYRRREDQVALEDQITQAETGIQPTIERQRRDLNETYNRNDFEASGVYKLSERFNIIGSYTNLWIDYEDETLSINTDRVENGLGARLEYIWKPQTSFSLGYLFSDIDYDNETNKVDSTTDTIYGGVNHTFSPSLSGNVNVGWQDRTYDPYTSTDEAGNEIVIEDKNETSPYVDLSISSMISEMLVSSVGYRYSITETDQSMFLSQQMQTFYLSLTNKFSERFSVRFNGIMTFGDFNVDVARMPNAPENMSEDAVQFALVFRYQIKQGWFAETGWRYTDVDSDFPGNTYERNRTFVGINAIF